MNRPILYRSYSPLLALLFCVPVTTRADDSSSGNWQVPKEIQKPSGPWKQPSEIPLPKEIATVKISDRSACERTFVLGADTLFEFDRFDLTHSGKRSIEALRKLIDEHAPHSVRIEGHTDSKGSVEYNESLSQKRAASVAAYVQALGALTFPLSTTGLGEKHPVAPNENVDGTDNPEGRAQNRRVEIQLEACADR